MAITFKQKYIPNDTFPINFTFFEKVKLSNAICCNGF